MLGLRHVDSLWSKSVFASALIFSAIFGCNADPYEYNFAGTDLMAHLEAIEDSESVDRALNSLLDLREDMKSYGCFVMPLSDMFRRLKDELLQLDIEISATDIDALIERIEELEEKRMMPYLSKVKHHKHHKHKKKKKLKMSSKMTFGFLKFVAGSICCIVPIPAVQGVGVFLAGAGINDMLEEAREEGEKNDKQEELRALERQVLHPA